MHKNISHIVSRSIGHFKLVEITEQIEGRQFNVAFKTIVNCKNIDKKDINILNTTLTSAKTTEDTYMYINIFGGICLSCYFESILWLFGFGYMALNNHHNIQKISNMQDYVNSVDNNITCDKHD
jgi:hypothetical protein